MHGCAGSDSSDSSEYFCSDDATDGEESIENRS